VGCGRFIVAGAEERVEIDEEEAVAPCGGCDDEDVSKGAVDSAWRGSRLSQR
jgi:hypothetical protein